MIVYHGSIITVERPDVLHSYRPLDFGKGFYVTSVREQAERWGRRKAALLGSDKAIINVYEMKENTDGLKIKSFAPVLIDWRTLKEIKVYPTYDQIAFITQEAIDRLLVFKSFQEV